MQLCNDSDNEYSNARFHSVYSVKRLVFYKLNVLKMSQISENQTRTKSNAAKRNDLEAQLKLNLIDIENKRSSCSMLAYEKLRCKQTTPPVDKTEKSKRHPENTFQERERQNDT